MNMSILGYMTAADMGKNLKAPRSVHFSDYWEKPFFLQLLGSDLPQANVKYWSFTESLLWFCMQLFSIQRTTSVLYKHV